MPAREFTSPELKTAHRHRVLLVDGFPDEAALYSEYLSHYGLQVQVCDRPDVAFSHAMANPPDVIVVRIRQAAGHMDGIELTGRLRHAAHTRDVPIVLLTTSVLTGDHDSAQDAGCSALMLLPVTPDGLLDELRSLIRTRRAR